jgi:hypothetical protein
MMKKIPTHVGTETMVIYAAADHYTDSSNLIRAIKYK